MSVDIKLLKKLRSETSASIGLCMKALSDNKNNYDAAKVSVEMSLRDSSKVRSSSSSGVSAVGFKIDNSFLCILKLGSETDFVLKNDLFYELMSGILDVMVDCNKEQVSIEDILNANKKGDSIKVTDWLTECSNVIGEKIIISEVKIFKYNPDEETIGVYVHKKIRDNMGALISVVVLNAKEGDSISELARDCAMHVAAMKPLSIDRNVIDKKFVDVKMSEIKEEYKNQNKPPKILENIINGAINKFYSAVCLIDQEYIKNPSISVGDLITSVGGKDLKVKDFFYISGNV